MAGSAELKQVQEQVQEWAAGEVALMVLGCMAAELMGALIEE